jgi:hypothetical protein
MTHAQFLNCVHRLLFDVCFGALGAILIIGAYRRWKWLVDPPLTWSPYYSQAAWKEMFGQRALGIFHLFSRHRVPHIWLPNHLPRS